ncbi:hypothetical protein [Maribacter dokdonensis]|uniref:hypothetical protein n=1 Tax=Maribacter dokdonensis TaxID=320912 RepID=UPI0032978377
MTDTDKKTDFLFPRRSFWTGFSSVLSIFGETNKFNTSKSGEEADYKALKSDWEMIGQDIRKVMSDEIKFSDCE